MRLSRKSAATLALCCACACVFGCGSGDVYLGSNISDGGSVAVHTDAGADKQRGSDAGGRNQHRSDAGASCPTGLGDCDGDKSNGCETDLAKDRDHCGTCEDACHSADCACQDGTPVAHCTGGRADCDGDPRDGCEVDLTSDANHCGSCDKACPARGFDTFGASCVAGHCMLTCEPSMADCDADPMTGCEAFLLFDNQNCGACGVVCPCDGGKCKN